MGGIDSVLNIGAERSV